MNPTTIGQLCRYLLTELDFHMTMLPRIPVPVMKDIQAKLQANPLPHADRSGGSRYDDREGGGGGGGYRDDGGYRDLDAPRGGRDDRRDDRGARDYGRGDYERRDDRRDYDRRDRDRDYGRRDRDRDYDRND